MKSLFSLTFIIALSACAHTRIAPRPLPSEASRLAQINHQPISFSVECPVEQIVGHQYLAIIIPFGRISLEDPALHIERALFQELVLAGYKPVQAPSSEASWHIRCQDISLSAYDLFFLRKIVARIDLEITNRGNQTMPIPNHTRLSVWKAFAFYPQLEYVFHRAGREAAQSLIKQAL